MVSVWERKCVRLWALQNWPLPSKPTAMGHSHTSYCVLICLPLFPTAGVTNIDVLTLSESHKIRPAVHIPRFFLTWLISLNH